MRRAAISIALSSLVMVVIVACGGGGGGGSGSVSTVPATLYHPSGRIAAKGQYAAGTTTPVGAWEEYFDAEGSPRRFKLTYVAGTWDRNQDWREWNQDGSVRFDWTDR